MRPLAVIDAEPGVGEGAQLGDRFKEVRVQHLSSVAPIERSINPAMPVTFLEVYGVASLWLSARRPTPVPRWVAVAF